jgi:hypothetical protein
MSWPDRCFHTQLLTAEMTDPRVFRAAGLPLALAAYEVADAGLQEALIIADEVATRSLHRLDVVGNQAVRAIVEKSGNEQRLTKKAARQLDYFAQRDCATVASIKTLLPAEVPTAVQENIAAHQAILREKAAAVKARIDHWLA